MAVKTATGRRTQRRVRGHAVVGANVALTVILAIVLVGGLQYIGYRWSTRGDLTSTGVNSLTEATTEVVEGLDTKVTLTSLYFETDLEEQDQERYRSAVADLLELYRATNRTQISAATINPLQDHEERKALFKELIKLDKFKNEAADHVAAIDAFRDELLPKLTETLGEELSRLEAFSALEGRDARLIGEVKQLYTSLQDNLQQTALDLRDAMASEIPSYSGAVNAIRGTYSTAKRMLENVVQVGDQLAAASDGQYAPTVVDYLVGAKARYADLLERIKEQEQKLNSLPPLEFDDIVRELRNETGNALLVQTPTDARVVAFRDLWAPINPRVSATGFADRKFQGEQKVTSAILQLTQTEKPAVVFVRYGGDPLLTGGFMPGQPQAPYAQMKTRLEDLNFSVHEWDLAAEDAMPEIDPAPSRVVFVVLRPTPSPPNFMGQPQQTPPFSPTNLETLKQALGEHPRALFIGGFMPSFSTMPAEYEYADYLRENWGIDAPSDEVLLYTEPIAVDKYRFVRNPVVMLDARYSDHPIVADMGEMPAMYPLVSPMTLGDAPEGVTTTRLAWFPERDGLWSVSDVAYYFKQQTNEFIVRDPNDLPGEFTLAAAAEKGEADEKGKVVFIGARDFATDDVALGTQMVLTAQGITTRPVNPGNAALFLNTLHWLNDNTEWMNLGTPIDAATLAVKDDSSAMHFVWALSVLILPGLALASGLVVWMVRRR